MTGLKKNLNCCVEEKRRHIEPEHRQISIARQCELLLLPRASYYYESCDIGEYNLQLMHLMDKEYTKHPFYGYRRLTAWLRRNGYEVNPKRVRRLMKIMGIEAIYQKPNLSKPKPNHKIYPYLLRGVKIERPDHVWSTDNLYSDGARLYISGSNYRLVFTLCLVI